MAEPSNGASAGNYDVSKWKRWRLHGPIIHSTGFYINGTIIIDNGVIEAVFDTRTEGPEPYFDAGSVNLLIIPGLIDLHNHAAYNFHPQWNPPAKFMSRFDWRGRNHSGVWINPGADAFYRNSVASTFKPMFENGCATVTDKEEREAALTAYGQIRALLGGCTTMVSDCDLDPDHRRRSLDHLGQIMRVENEQPTRRVWAVLDVPCIEKETKSPENFVLRMKEDLKTGKGCLLVHVAEGLDPASHGEFWTLRDRELVTANTALIHGLGLQASDWKRVAQARASLIWAPTSNIRLYGRTVDIAMIASHGIDISLAPDWTISGSSSIIDELAFVRDNYGGIFSAQRLFDMVTKTPGKIIAGAENRIGIIAPGAVADFVFLKVPAMPQNLDGALEAVLKQSSVNNVRGVVVKGRPVLGSADFGPPGEGEDFYFVGDDKERQERRLYLSTPIGKITSLAALTALIETTFRPLAPHTEGAAPLWEPLNL